MPIIPFGASPGRCLISNLTTAAITIGIVDVPRLSKKYVCVLRTSLSVLLALGFLVRPSNFEAILIHNHGDDGLHVHALTLNQAEDQLESHDNLHGLEHWNSADVTVHKEQTADHSEDCGSLVLILGNAVASARSVDVGQHTGEYRDLSPHVPIGFQLDPAGTGVELLLGMCAVPKSGRCLDAILQSNHSILI